MYFILLYFQVHFFFNKQKNIQQEYVLSRPPSLVSVKSGNINTNEFLTFKYFHLD